MNELTAEPGVEDATRRTFLAHERTQLAWGRTGLASFAVALAVGKALPKLDGSSAWPYTALGTGFALYGIGLVVYGGMRKLEPKPPSANAEPPHILASRLFAIAGGILGVGTVLLIVASP